MNAGQELSSLKQSFALENRKPPVPNKISNNTVSTDTTTGKEFYRQLLSREFDKLADRSVLNKRRRLSTAVMHSNTYSQAHPVTSILSQFDQEML